MPNELILIIEDDLTSHKRARTFGVAKLVLHAIGGPHRFHENTIAEQPTNVLDV